jgi:hypothetical protein
MRTVNRNLSGDAARGRRASEPCSEPSPPRHRVPTVPPVLSPALVTAAGACWRRGVARRRPGAKYYRVAQLTTVSG